MRTATLTAVLSFVPAIAFAQAGPPNPPKTPPAASAQATSNGNVGLSSGKLSASAQTKIDAIFQTAKSKNLPDQPIRERIAEGQAKGAAEAQIVDAAQGVETRLEASQAALIKAGRAQPQPTEIASAAQAMERGANDTHIAALAKHAPADRSLAVSFSVLAKLTANGESVDNALAKIAAKLDAGETDDALASLAGSAPGNPPTASKPPEGATAGANAAAAGSAAVGTAKGVTAGVTGTVKGAVSGVVTPIKP